MSDDHNHDHKSDHNHEHAHPDAAALLTAVRGAQTGLKSQVEKLAQLLPESALFIPLAEDLPGAPENEDIAIEGDLTFRPHMIVGQDDTIFAVAYTEPNLVEEIRETLGWETSGGELKFIHVPASVALDLSQSDVEGDPLTGLVINPGTDDELILQRDEAASLAQGVALPLVGYVDDLPPGDDEQTELIEGGEPPPPALLEALKKAAARHEALNDVQVVTTFNPERDREPHLTIILELSGTGDINRQELAEDVMEEAGPLLPGPGYADVVFRDAPN